MGRGWQRYPWAVGGREPRCYQMRGESRSHGSGSLSTIQHEWNIWHFILFLYHPVSGIGASYEGGEGGNLGSILSLWGRGAEAATFFFSSWCLARIEWLFLKRFSTFLDCSSPDHLTERETFLLGIFYFLVYVCAHWHFQVASFSSVQSGVYEGKRKPRNASPCRSLGPDVPRQIPFFLPFRVYLCLLYIECPGFLVALSGRNMEKYFYSIQKELFLQIRHV